MINNLIFRFFTLTILLTALLALPSAAQMTDDCIQIIDPFAPIAVPSPPEWLPAWDSVMAADTSRVVTGGEANRCDSSGMAAVSEPKKDPVKLFNRAMALQWQQLSRETNRALDSMPPKNYLRMMPAPGRKPVLMPPYKLKTARNVSNLLRVRMPATFAKFYATDSTVQSMSAWYAKQFGFSFRIETSFIDSARPELGSLTVARAVKRVGNSVVSVMIWNPRIVAIGGRRRQQTSKIENRTTVSTQERAFRPREILVPEGVDAMVEFTWKVPYGNLIQQAATKYQIDPHLLAALIQQESNFSKTALSVDSAQGLMQMIPATAERMGVKDPMNPAQAIEGGVKYFKMMLRRYKGNALLALAAYNAGPGNVDKYRGIPPFAETRDYVKRIMSRYKEKAGGARAQMAELVLPSTGKKVAIPTVVRRKRRS